MKKYIFGRFVRSIISILGVMCIAILLVYTLVPRYKIFQNDPNIAKLQGDAYTTYINNKYAELGYQEFLKQSDICAYSSDYTACMNQGKDLDNILEELQNKGFAIEHFKDGTVYATRDYSPFELIGNFFSKLIQIDHPGAINDPNNPNLERKYYVASGPNGIPAVKCSGCKYQYQLYVDSSFPFIHQNVFRLHFGYSFPTFSGVDTMEVISKGQNGTVNTLTTFPTGLQANSATNLYTCKYKETLDHLDTARFDTNYANCDSNYDAASMTATSYTFGVIALILAYLISVPAGIMMARKKDKWQDKLGVVYINFMIAVPSLAFIYFAKQLGSGFGFPDKFPQFGPHDIRSYILPIIILALLSTASIMIWIRRYMIDQSSSDYVKFARAKGLNEREIFNNHILKNAIIPIVNGIPSSIILCISGSVITESVFAIPGMGKMLPDSIKAYNNNMVITLTFIFTALSIFSLLLGDILMTVVDPRIQLSAKGDSR